LQFHCKNLLRFLFFAEKSNQANFIRVPISKTSALEVQSRLVLILGRNIFGF